MHVCMLNVCMYMHTSVEVKDTTGAGDCFTGAYTVALLERMPEAERLRFACAAAAVCVQRKGAMPSMPTRSELQELIHRD